MTRTKMVKGLLGILFVWVIGLATDLDRRAGGVVEPNEREALGVRTRALKSAYEMAEPVQLALDITNSGPEAVYLCSDESGVLDLAVRVTDHSGRVAIRGPIPTPPPPPPYYYVSKNGERVFTVPATKIESKETKTFVIADALKYYRRHLEAGTYYLIPSDIPIIHEVGAIILRDDVPHPLWIDPLTIRRKSRYSTGMVSVTLR